MVNFSSSTKVYIYKEPEAKYLHQNTSQSKYMWVFITRPLVHGKVLSTKCSLPTTTAALNLQQN